MRRKFLLAVMTLSLLFCAMGAGDLYAQTEVATSDALQTALSSDGEVKLINNITVDATVTVAESVTATLDLNGFAITGTMHKSNGGVIKNNGSLTLIGGTIKSTADNGGSALVNSGEAIVNNVTLIGAPNAGGSWPSYTVNNTGVMSIIDSKLTSYHGTIASYGEGAVVTMTDTDIDMSGIAGFTSHAIYTYSDGAAVVYSGDIANKATDQNNTGGSVINGAVTIYGGNFNGRVENYSGTPVIYAGTFKHGETNLDVSRYVAAGCEYNDGVVTAPEGYIFTAEQLKTSLQKSGTYTLGADITVTEQIEVPFLSGDYKPVEIALNLNGHKIIADGKIYPINNNGNLTINDIEGNTGGIEGLGLLNGKDGASGNTRSAAASLTINGGTYKNLFDEGAALYAHLGSITINGGRFIGKHAAVWNENANYINISGGYFEGDYAAIINEKYIKFDKGELNGLYLGENGYSCVVSDDVIVYEARIIKNSGYTSYKKLEDAVEGATDGDVITIITNHNGSYKVPSGKNITITGADVMPFIKEMPKEPIKFANIGAHNMYGASMTFNNVTFDYYPNVKYTGLQHSGNLVYNNCTFEGQPFLYGTSETFNNCTFNQNSSDAYNVWTYGAAQVAFNECTFNSAGKSVLVYNEGACATDLTVTDTKFIATATVDDKAAIEIDCSSMPKGTSIVINGVDEGKTTATGFGTNTKSGSSLWNDKKVVEGAPNGGTSSEVIIDDVVVKEPALMNLAGEGTEENPYLISTLEDLIWFRYQVNAGVNYYKGKYIALAADIDLAGENWVGIGSINADHGFMGNFDGKTYKIKNLTITDPALDSDGYAYAGFFGVTEGTDKDNQNTIKNLTIENVTINTDGHIAAAAIAYPYYTIVENVTVCGDIKIQGGDYTAGALAYTRHCVNASNIIVSGSENSYITGAKVVGGVISDIQMNGGLTANYSDFNVSGVKITGTNMVGGISGIISSQTLNGCSVNNVTLSCQDNNRIGIVSGSLGGVSTVSDVGYVNVTGATAIIGATYDGGKAVEAKIGDTYYATLQAAIDAAQDGTTTINILADITGDVAILQQEGKNIVIDGKKNDTEKYTFNGKISIDGNRRHTGEETLTIQNVNFYTEKDSHDFIWSDDITYAHNVTVKDCNFGAKEGSSAVVGLRIRQGYDLAVIGGESNNYMHSLMQFSGCHGTTVDGVTFNGLSGVNLNTAYDVTIKNSEFNVAEYAVRVGENSEAQQTEKNITITNNKLTSTGGTDAVIIVRQSNDNNNLNISENNIIGDTHIAVTTTFNGSIAADANYWGEGLTGPVVAGTNVDVNSYYADAAREQLIVTALTLQQFVEKVTEGNGTYNGTFTEGGVEKNITVKVVPVSGDARSTNDVRVPNRLQKYTNPEVFYAQYQRFSELTDVNISNVNFVFYPAAVTVTDAWNTAGATTTAENINGELQLLNTGSVSFAYCSFEKMSVSPINAATLSVTSSTFNGLDAYAIKDIKATTATITGTTFTYCNGGFWFNNAPTKLTVTGNTFTGTGRRGAIQFSANGDYVNTEMTVTGNTVTDEAAFLWQLNNTISNAQLNAILDKNNNTYETAFVAGSVELHLQGEGTEENPYLINDISDLEFFRDQVNGGNNYAGKHVKLEADINLAEGQNRSTESNWEPISTFNGVFDGNDKTISNLVVNGEGNSNQGFFGQTNNGEIKNLTINNAKVTGRFNVGVVAGTPYTSKYTNIKVTGHVEVNGMSYVGGVGGKNAYADWTNIAVDVDEESYVEANSTENGTNYRTYVGGVIGFNGEGSHTFKNITSNIKVKGNICDIGGIFGIVHYGNKVENVSCSAIVESTGEADELGGIAGVWHNRQGQTVTMNDVEFTGTVKDVNGEVEGVDIVGGAYNADNETADNSGSLIIDGNEAWLKVAQIDDAKYLTLAAAAAAAQANETITLLADVEENVTLPSDITFNGNGKSVSGTITADGNLTFMGVTKVDGFSAGYYNHTINIGEGASLEVTTNRLTVSYGNVFNITGSIENAKTADKSNITPSLRLTAGASFNGDGGGVNFNVKNAYVVIGDASTKHGGATGEFNLNFNNSIVDFTKTLKTYEPTESGLSPVVNVNMTNNSVVSFASHLELWRSATNFTLDESNLTVGGSFANAGIVTVKNGANFVVNAPIMSSHGGNTGTIVADGGTFELKDSNQDWENAGTMKVTATGKFITNDFKCVGEGKMIVDAATLENFATATVIDGNGVYNFEGVTTLENANGVTASYENGDVTITRTYVAKIGDTYYATLAEAVTAAANDATIELIWQEGQAPIAMNASLYGKDVTITGTATVDWSKGNLFVGRGGNINGEGDATLTFYNANLTSASNQASTGIHVSGREKDTNNKYDGTLVIKNSIIELDYLIDRGTITLDEGANLTVKNGFGIAGRPALETEDNNPATATISLIKGAKLIVNNHNGMGVGQAAKDPEGYGIMNIDATSTFETTQDFLITAKGTMNNNGGNITINGTLTVNGNLNSSGNITGNITKADAATIILTGGTYTQDVNAWCHEDYDAIDNGNNTWTVIQVSGTQTTELITGWNWFSTYIKQGNDGLSLLQNALNPNGVEIKNREGFTRYYPGLKDWSPSQTLTSVSTTKMYMIKTSAAHILELEGSFEDENVEITIAPGWNWIGYPVHEEGISFEDALSNIEPAHGDIIKSQSLYAQYIDMFGTAGWAVENGESLIMNPGEGYKYYSNKSQEFRFTYSTEVNSKRETSIETIDNYWLTDANQYSGNMTMLAMLSVDGEIVKGNYEVAAFANGECRGSARPIYIEALDAYVLLLTIHGEEVEELTFKYYDVNYGTEYELNNRINYSDDAIVGSFEEPYMFNLGILNIDETSVDQISIYPNPTTTGKEINLQAMCDKVEVFNALGVKVAEYTNVDSIDALETAGIYVIRVTIDGNARNCRLVVR